VEQFEHSRSWRISIDVLFSTDPVEYAVRAIAYDGAKPRVSFHGHGISVPAAIFMMLRAIDNRVRTRTVAQEETDKLTVLLRKIHKTWPVDKDR